jgi:phage baseplate assembly protein W
MSETAQQEIRANLIHLLLTRKGSRYFLPDFGTRLYEYIFEQMDPQTFSHIEDEIREVTKKYIPNLDITSIVVTPQQNLSDGQSEEAGLDSRVYRAASDQALPYTAQVRIDYSVSGSAVWTGRDFIILNL